MKASEIINSKTNTNPEIANTIEINPKLIEQGHDLGDWFIFRENRHFGPLTAKKINQLLFSHLLSLEHHIWRPGFNGWVKLKDIEAFRSYGKNQIELITDNDFSFQAELGPIDRIKFQENDISFVENDKVKILQIDLKSEVTQKLNSLSEKIVSNYYQVLEFLKIDKKYAFKVAIGITSIFILSNILLIYSFIISPHKNNLVSELPYEVRRQLIQNAIAPATLINPRILLVEKDKGLKDPVLVGSVNLPFDAKIKIIIEGKPETLNGTYRFRKQFNLVLTSPIFQTEPIRGATGEFISPGEYLVKVICESCETKDKTLTSTTYRFGITNSEKYIKELREFHIKTRESANIELDELDDLSETLMDQYQRTISIYNRSINSKNLESWNKFAVGWLATQKKIVDMFDQIATEDFKSKVYYLPIYEAYGVITRLIFELHVTQDKYLSGETKNLEVVEKTRQLSEDIKLKMSYLNSQTDLMRINYTRSSGLPSQDGLNLKKF